jgi:hypothetical protein
LTVLGLGGLLAYSGSEPWLLPAWLLIVPLAALLLAWVGRGQILRSEDTLSGLSLCNWAIGIVVVFGLMYGAYYTATYVAVRRQASSFADDWVGRLKKGDIPEAFALTQPPDKRPAENAELRNTLELLFNTPGPNGVGMFTDFNSKDYVRFLQGASGDVTVTPTGLREWKNEGGAYQALYGYHVKSSVCTFDMAVLVHGQQSQDPTKGRQWYVDIKQTGRAGPPTFTEQGQLLSDEMVPGRAFIKDWFENWYREEDAAYLLTLPADQRAEVLRQRPVLAAAVGATALMAEPGRKPFYEGSLVVADPKFYVVKQDYREVIPALLKQTFRPGEYPSADKPDKAVTNDAAGFPLLQSTATGKRFLYDVRFVFKEGRVVLKEGRLLETRPVEVDARVALDCDDASLARKQPQWQFSQIQLLRAGAVGGGSPSGPGRGPVRVPIPEPAPPP